MNSSNVDAFTKELEQLINKYSIDNDLNIPDFILADYMVDNLWDVKKLIIKRDKWFGFIPFLDRSKL